MKLAVFLVFIFCSFPLYSAPTSSVILDIEEYACIDGWEAMDITVEVNEESFTFNADCHWDLTETLKTEKGMLCLLEGEMCWGDNEWGEIQVSCEDGSDESQSFRCPLED